VTIFTFVRWAAETRRDVGHTLVEGGNSRVAKRFTGAQKAAIVILRVGKERAAPILREMREAEVAEIMAEVAKLQHLEPSDVEEVINEFRDTCLAQAAVARGGYSTARDMLEASFGSEKADAILDHIGVSMVAAPFEFLRRADTRQVLTYLQD
jgi:flagellar motor switch protein FliG